MPKITGLGRGLSSLIPGGKQPATLVTEQRGGGLMLDPSIIEANPDQPRTTFDNVTLQELTDSIRQHGILQPLVVMKEGNRYTLISGERRLRAAKRLRLQEVPVILREASEIQRLELALIENIQREDLNPMELAESFARLIDEFGLTHEQVAERVGKSRVTITNTLRLLQLPRIIQEAIAGGTISMGHARAIVGLPNEKQQLEAFEQIVHGKLSVRDIEGHVARVKAPAFSRRNLPDVNLRSKEEVLEEALGTTVSIQDRGGKGEIRVRYYSLEELHGIIQRIATSRNR